MENFSQIMDPDYASLAYQSETNIVGMDILQPPVHSQTPAESFATIPSSATDSISMPEQIFEESASASVVPSVAETLDAPTAIENHTTSAIDSAATPCVEGAASQNDVSDAPAGASNTEPAATADASAPGESDKKGTSENETEESLIVPDEKTKRKDAVEEEINKNQCRVCLSTDDLVDVYKFYDKGKKLQICDLVTKLCPTLRIHERDYLPQFVCSVCEDRLIKAFELKLQCEAIDRELRSKLPRRKLKARSATEFVLIDCKDLSSGSEEEDEALDDDEFHLSEEISSSSDLDSDASSEPEKKRRPPSKRIRKPPPAPPQKRPVAPMVYVHKPQIKSKPATPVAIGNIKVERIDANRTPAKRVHHYQCSICRKTFTDQTVFNNHVQMHRDEKARTCVQCKHKFVSVAELQRHIRMHHITPKATTPSDGHNANVNNKRRSEPETPGNGERDLFKTVAPLTTTYWSDSFSD